MTLASFSGWTVAQWDALTAVLTDATESAAAACYPWIGKGDKVAADDAAVNAMLIALAKGEFDFTIRIGEGELDAAPMLDAGQRIGKAGFLAVDIAVDPLEGTTLCAKGLSGAVTTIAGAPSESMLSAPDSYMYKLMAGPSCPEGIIDVDKPIGQIIHEYSEAVGKPCKDITICVLDKPRHRSLIDTVLGLGVQVSRLNDGDVPAALWVCEPDVSGIDLYVGIGGGPEGVLSAVALKCLGGKMSARFAPQRAADRDRLIAWDARLLDLKFSLNDIVRHDAIFSMTSVTGTTGLRPAIRGQKGIVVESIVLATGRRKSVLRREI
jgi:fructose-1,6-bisphosphatase II / sedoheptulose-1,7-bisphosphatase